MALSKTKKKPYQLVAVGRLPASTLDKTDVTLGSFSGLTLAPGSWRATKDGYAGVFIALPDRGYNDPDHGVFSDYPARFHRIAFELKGDMLSLRLLETHVLRDKKGRNTTGLDPGTGRTKQFGATLPSPADGKRAGRIAIDAEGIAPAPDGGYFISDELGANIYRCTKTGQIVDVITPAPAFIPYINGKVCFTSLKSPKPERGRSPNDGFEGLSLSPTGRKLYALLQSPLMQDRDKKSGAPDRYTRLLVLDVSKKRTPRKPFAHYVVELPLYKDPLERKLKGVEVNEVVALGKGRILVLAREGYGFGAKPEKTGMPIVFKRVMFGRLDGASDIAGKAFERKAKPVVVDGKLVRSIKPVKLTPLVDIADEVELNRVKLTAKKASATLKLLSAKWESLVLSPPLDPKQPRERLLFIGNDNDFRARHIVMPDKTYPGDPESEHDNMILAYRITLPD